MKTILILITLLMGVAATAQNWDSSDPAFQIGVESGRTEGRATELGIENCCADAKFPMDTIRRPGYANVGPGHVTSASQPTSSGSTPGSTGPSREGGR